MLFIKFSVQPAAFAMLEKLINGLMREKASTNAAGGIAT